ncbi:helix-turn-helix domain-containing protein [Streptomyces inhibens]|uniref:helix-turn-helix domain-containing protein n=1 Tax=Streptomyces inhibens TaxID=2293571 RepID=UPI001EE77C67|nr:helix-turn-helix domain-containing protein [Streptomyces inhibens]UKY47822.1 helix-turn-helix domain-containing protein [Streptomyces inhibens]
MNWQTGPIRDASRAGDYGRVIALAREEQRMTQSQLGQACGLSQSAVSHLEKRGAGAYSTDILAAASAHLGFPPALVGLVDGRGRRRGPVNGSDSSDVDRRQFLGGAAAVAATPVLDALPDPADTTTGQAAALRLSTTAYRRLDGTTPSRDLSDTVESHLRLIQSITRNATDDAERRRLAAVGSEAASLAGWLAWDRGDDGSARSWYGSAIKAAGSAGDPLLAAYQLGTLAQFEADNGNATEALNLTRRARRSLGAQRPSVADAWLSSVEALAHAAGGDRRSADRALTASRTAAETLPAEVPPWPWVFRFDPVKAAACRVTCGARLGLPEWVLGDGTEALATGHAKQRALLVLDIAAGHLAGGQIEAAFALAGRALETGLQYRSGRIVERVRAVRRSLTSGAPPRVVRDLDERLHGVCL